MIRPTDDDADFKMMSTPNEWPRWPMLPLKNMRDRLGGWPKMGVLINPSIKTDELYFGEGVDLFSKPKLGDLEKIETPERLRELIDAGWIVD